MTELASPLEQHRIDRFLELGFTQVDAATLARTPLYWGQAKKLLEQGCAHAQVVHLYA